MATTSASGNMESRSFDWPTRSIKAGAGVVLRRVPHTRMPKPWPRCAISVPMPPMPTTSIVRPSSAISGTGVMTRCQRCSAWLAA